MAKAIRPILFSSTILAAIIAIMYALNMVDHIVHGQLYEYGLQFNLNWAGPYWNLLRVVQICLGIIAGVTVIDLALTIKGFVNFKRPGGKIASVQKPPLMTRASTRTESSSSAHPIPSPTRASESPLTIPASPPTPASLKNSELQESPRSSIPSNKPTYAVSSSPSTSPRFSTSDIPGLIRCSHCGKAFTQPLRMLDFQGDRPRIVSICPFCNEIIKPESTLEKSRK